jgi:hypothetical protein
MSYESADTHAEWHDEPRGRIMMHHRLPHHPKNDSDEEEVDIRESRSQYWYGTRANVNTEPDHGVLNSNGMYGINGAMVLATPDGTLPRL